MRRARFPIMQAFGTRHFRDCNKEILPRLSGLWGYNGSTLLGTRCLTSNIVFPLAPLVDDARTKLGGDRLSKALADHQALLGDQRQLLNELLPGWDRYRTTTSKLGGANFPEWVPPTRL